MGAECCRQMCSGRSERAGQIPLTTHKPSLGPKRTRESAVNLGIYLMGRILRTSSSGSFSATKTGQRHTTRAEMETPMSASEHNSIERSKTHDIRSRTIRNSRRSRSAPEDHAPSGARNDSPWTYPSASVGNRQVSEGVAVQDQRSGGRHSLGRSEVSCLFSQ